MLFSHSEQEKAFDFFASFLRNVLNGDDRYRQLVQPLINDAKLLVEGQKDFFQVDRNGFDVIVYLAEKAPEYLRALNLQALSKENYEYLLKLITTQRDLIVA